MERKMDHRDFTDIYNRSVEKIGRNRKRMGVAFPHVADGERGEYNREDASFWTGGFWGGLLWLAYRACGDRCLFETACEIEAAQDIVLDGFIGLHHDVGFMWLPTSVMHYKSTGCEASRVRALKGASILAGRFNPAGRFIRSWNEDVRKGSQGLVIVDSLMNLPLLYWAGRELADPRFFHIARAHGDTVLKYFMRPDYTVPHIAGFNPDTGDYEGPVWGQGKSADSSWSRGQAWAVYGFAASYRETGCPAYLKAAEDMARHFYESLPEDLIPLWDFCSDEEDRYARDTSAACIAASGMLEIAGLEKDREMGSYFLNCAKGLLESLINRCVRLDDGTQGIVEMGTVNYLHGKYINVPIIYGDFFFVEALGKLQGLRGVF